MRNFVRKIIVVGGGTAGCIAALMLKQRFPNKEIVIIESANIGIIGVGESSTEHWMQFSKYIGLDDLDPIYYCDATFKHGVYFENWADNNFIHNIAQPQSTETDFYYPLYGHLISNKKHPFELGDSVFLDEQEYFNYPKCYTKPHGPCKGPGRPASPTNQYHFDTFKLNEYLHLLCKDRDISIEVDDIKTVNLDPQSGDIVSVSSETTTYSADFFIDCTGFAKFLLHKTYDIPWISYAKYLPVNSAFAFATEEMEEYNSYTKSTARDAGWSWTIPTQKRTGNGYVYCDKFITKDQAYAEMVKAYGKELEISKEFKFDPGRLERAWHKNCYAVGLSQSFVEPLEATSIGSVIQQMFCFMHFLPSYDHISCNKHVNDTFENIVDYIRAHYLTNREDTPFWRDVKYNLPLTPNLERYLSMWEKRLPIDADLLCPWGMFGAINYIPILYGLKWFNIGNIQLEYMEHLNMAKTQELIPTLEDPPCGCQTIHHRKLIRDILRNKFLI